MASQESPPISPKKVASPRRNQAPPEPQGVLGALSRLLHAPVFDHIMGAVIMLNMLVIIIETDHAADHDDILKWVDAVGWAILIIFFIELILRLVVLRLSFFHDHWNTFDFFIVGIDSLFSFLGLILGSVFPVSTLRVFRLCKLARVSKVFRVFPELRIMMAGLLGSIRAIFWGSVLLTFVLLVWAIVAVQFIHPLNKELTEKHLADGCERCPRAYESVLQSFLTFWQQIVAGDSWGQATIPLIEAYPVTALYFLGVHLTVGFAVMNLILGVVVNVAQSEHDRLQGEIAEEANIIRLEAHNNLRSICEQMDRDGSGELSKEELLNGYNDRGDFRAAIEDLELTLEDMKIAFAGMDTDKSGSVSYDEFLKKIYKMKDSDAQFLMEQVKANIIQVKDAIMGKLMAQEAELISLQNIEIDSLKTIEEQGAEALRELAVETSPVSSSNVEKKDQKPPLKDSSGKSPGAANEAKDIAKLQSVAGEGQSMQDIRDAIMNASSLLEGEFRDTLKSIEATLKIHASDTSSSLSQMQRPTGPMGYVDMVSARRGLAGSPICCTTKV